MVVMKNPPEKVLLMYQAVIDLICDARDVNSLKVSDITARAGIGKGTAYEYFSSKEDIILGALIYECQSCVRCIMDGVEEKKYFKDKVLYILHWIYTNGPKHFAFFHIFQTSGFNYGVYSVIEAELSDRKIRKIKKNIEENVSELMESGYKEHIFTETDSEKRKLAFFAAVFECMFTCGENCFNISSISMGEDELETFVYQSMVKALN